MDDELVSLTLFSSDLDLLIALLEIIAAMAQPPLAMLSDEQLGYIKQALDSPADIDILAGVTADALRDHREFGSGRGTQFD